MNTIEYSMGLSPQLAAIGIASERSVYYGQLEGTGK